MRSRARGEHLAHLVVLAALVDQLLRAGRVVGRAAPLLGELGGGLEPAVLAAGLGVAVAVPDHRGVDICAESSAKRASICSTSDSIMRGRG